MTGPTLRRPFLLLAGLVFFCIAAAAVLPGGLELRALPVKGGEPALVLPMAQAERFVLYYLHSVENAPIWETHSVDGKGRIYIEEEKYLKFGAGMGRMPGVGRMTMRGPYEVIEEMHMPTGDFVLRVGSRSVAHTVIWRGIGTNLSASVPHVAVRFSARPVSLLYTFCRNLMPHAATPVQAGRNPST